jgi:hypothetical protein
MPLLGDVIAKRTLYVKGRKEPVEVLIGRPRRGRGKEEFRCPYQIEGVGDEAVRSVPGSDAVQALQLVMQAIGVELQQSGLSMTWIKGMDGYLGFPLPSDSKMPQALQRKVDKAADRILARK